MIKITDTVYVLDIDGNTVAVFAGYAWKEENLSPEKIAAAYVNVQKLKVVNRRGEWYQTIKPEQTFSTVKGE